MKTIEQLRANVKTAAAAMNAAHVSDSRYTALCEAWRNAVAELRAALPPVPVAAPEPPKRVLRTVLGALYARGGR